jgi:hypothetical protein
VEIQQSSKVIIGVIKEQTAEENTETRQSIRPVRNSIPLSNNLIQGLTQNVSLNQPSYISNQEQLVKDYAELQKSHAALI